jgi:Protein of unknown function (DUF433)
VPVDLVVGKLAGGMTIEQIIKEYELTREDVLAALSYAALALGEEGWVDSRIAPLLLPPLTPIHSSETR